MAAVQIGKYKRPGIFIEEFDQSIITSPVVDGITNMIIGVSKKGPVNTPILLKTLGDLEAIFGQLDRNLERKGSFYHRTISKMLETSPIYAINLLATDDNLDTIEYRSLSSASNYNNDIVRTAPYRRFFDTTGFWKKDTESFTNITKNNAGYSERAFSLTNMSDRYITTFVFKTKRSGFDRTLIEWYGSVEKMPPYVSQTDYASDYMVDIVVVGGDWSNYQQLSVDPRWSAYFSNSGLRKDQVRNFANDRNITLLAYYEGISLIPYFRDGNGKNIFIETVINRDTDKTGLFCSFNNDLVESDFKNGLIDLIGNNLVGSEDGDIDFLSYKDTISESVSITNMPLDLPGNVSGLGNGYGSYSIQGVTTHAYGSPVISGSIQNSNRTGWFAEGYVNDISGGSSSMVTSTSSISVSYTSGSNAYTIIGGSYIATSGATSTIVPSAYTAGTHSVPFVIDTTGSITSVTTPSSTDVVLGYVTFQVSGGFFTGTPTFTHISVKSTGYNELTFGTGSNDYYVTNLNNGSVKVEFNNTANTANPSNYSQYRRIKIFNNMINLLDGPNKDKMTMVINSTSMEKVSLSGMTITNIVTSNTSNKSFVLNTGLSSTQINSVINGYLLFYTTDNEFIFGKASVDTDRTGTGIIPVATISGTSSTNGGIVAKYSTLYTKFVDGQVNTGDYFYSNLISNPSDILFLAGEDAPSGATSVAGNDYIIFHDPLASILTDLFPNGVNALDQLYIPDSTQNLGSITILSGSDVSSLLGFTSSGYFAFQVNENLVSEELFGVTNVYNYLVKHYLKAYLDNDSNLHVDFVDSTLQSIEPVDIVLNNTSYIQSLKSNFHQTIEIESPLGYIQTPNKILINGSRYTEIKVGDFLEAYVDISSLEVGEVPKKLTRILSKKTYAPNTSLVEISCDARIASYNFGGDLQTERYTTIEDYVTTYKAITLKGFRIRQDSLPDGSEDRQNEILNLVAKGTPLFKAITNKEAIDFRYLIDSFGLGLTERSKQQLVDICGERLDSFGFINMPSMKSFKNSTSPTFVNSEGVLQTEFIAMGGDPESNPAFLYSFGDGSGTTCTGYFTPYVSVNDNGRPLFVPPSSFVATTYMRKHISNITSMTPWTIAAGVTNGKVTNISGLEIDFNPTDIENLNQSQMNPIVFKRNRGYVIETENTSQTLYKSALSYIHVREVLIELERELSRMLLDFQWKFNTPDIRSEIKLRADVICETYVSKNGLFNYFNKIDEENNTADIIDNQLGVLDTYVEPVKGMGVIVNNITILRTGAIQSGGFIIP
jgi:hypothetical protein